MAENVDERIPEILFVNMMVEKGTIIRDHLKCKKKYMSINHSGQHRDPLWPYLSFMIQLKKMNSLKLQMTLSNLGDIDEQLHILWQQINFLLHQYCSQCGSCNVDSTSTSH